MCAYGRVNRHVHTHMVHRASCPLLPLPARRIAATASHPKQERRVSSGLCCAGQRPRQKNYASGPQFVSSGGTKCAGPSTSQVRASRIRGADLPEDGRRKEELLWQGWGSTQGREPWKIALGGSEGPVTEQGMFWHGGGGVPFWDHRPFFF